MRNKLNLAGFKHIISASEKKDKAHTDEVPEE